MLVLFLVFYISAYSSLTSGRISYAGNQIGTTFAIVVAGLSLAINIYQPLWRVWGILLGCSVVALVVFILAPEYAADSLLPRLKKLLEHIRRRIWRIRLTSSAHDSRKTRTHACNRGPSSNAA